MLYTVKETAVLAKVTVKTLHHYHKIGLLLPAEVSEASYRLYGMKELERLQHILFYRELDFPLKKIQEILDGNPERLSVLSQQRQLIDTRKKRLEQLIKTLDESIGHAKKGEVMSESKLFKGFENEKEWKAALSEQKTYLKEKYDYDIIKENPIDVESMNETALEAKRFMDEMIHALQEGIKYDDKKVRYLIHQHLAFLNEHGHEITARDFVDQNRFFLHDDFHRNMLEAQQTGLSYFLCIAAEAYASEKR